MVPISPGLTKTDAPVVELLPVDVERPDVATDEKPAVVTVAVSPAMPLTQTLRMVSLVLGPFVSVHTIAVSAALMVSALPLSGMAFPVQVTTARYVAGLPL